MSFSGIAPTVQQPAPIITLGLYDCPVGVACDPWCPDGQQPQFRPGKCCDFQCATSGRLGLLSYHMVTLRGSCAKPCLIRIIRLERLTIKCPDRNSSFDWLTYLTEKHMESYQCPRKIYLCKINGNQW